VTPPVEVCSNYYTRYEAIFVIPGIATAQLVGIASTVALALTGGVISGFILQATGAKQKAYKDYEEFDAVSEP
jgi:ammonium transporter Rh